MLAGRRRPRFPQLYAAASLKHGPGRGPGRVVRRFSAAICCGLIEARLAGEYMPASRKFSAAICCGLIEAPETLQGLVRIQ